MTDSNADLIRQIADDVFGDVEDLDVAEVGRERLWPTVVELGWPLVGIPEDRGGAGGELADLLTLAGSVGRHGAAVPLLEQALATWILTQAGEDAPTELVTVACPLDGVLDVTDGTASGSLRGVPWATDAVAVLAATADGRIVRLESSAEGVRREDGSNLAGEPRSDLTVDGASVTVLDGAPDVDLVVRRGALLSTAAIVGALEGAYELTRVYVGEREQFDRPLARFQVVSSALADMSSQVSVARSALDAAVDDVDGAAPSELAVTLARVTVVDVVKPVGEHAHHLHGAMGITREYPLHRATRRLWSWRDEWGSERSWRRRLGRRVVAGGVDAFWDEVTALCDSGVPA
jgi:acyl-CoA dehydrogenase